MNCWVHKVMDNKLISAMDKLVPHPQVQIIHIGWAANINHLPKQTHAKISCFEHTIFGLGCTQKRTSCYSCNTILTTNIHTVYVTVQKYILHLL